MWLEDPNNSEVVRPKTIMLNGVPTEVSDKKAVVMNGKPLIELINYDWFQQAKAEYFDRTLKEKWRDLTKVVYGLSATENPSMYTMLTTIIDNCSLDKNTQRFTVHGNWLSSRQKIPEWLTALAADPDNSPAAKILRRVHKEMLEVKWVGAHKRPGYQWIYDVISNLNSAYDLKPYLQEQKERRQREGRHNPGERSMTYTERIGVPTLPDKPDSPKEIPVPTEKPKPIVKKTYTEIPKPNNEAPEVLHIGQDWLHDDARVNESQFDQKKIDYVAIGKKIAQGKNFTFVVSAGVDRRPVRITSRPIVDNNYQQAEANMDTMLTTKQKDILCDKYYPMMMNAKNIGEQYNMKLLLARTMAPVKQIHEKIFAPYLASLDGNASKKAVETQRLLSMIQIGELRVWTKANKNLQQDRYTNLTA